MADMQTESNIDPAALLGVGLAAAIAVVSSSGPWTLTETFIGLVLVVIILAFGSTSRMGPAFWPRAAWWAVAALSATLTLAFPFQQFLVLRTGFGRDATATVARVGYATCSNVNFDDNLPLDEQQDNLGPCFDDASTDSLALTLFSLGALLVVAGSIRRRAATGRLKRHDIANGASESRSAADRARPDADR